MFSKKKRTSVEPLPSAVKLACTIHYISGGSFYDISTYTGISMSAFYPTIYGVMHAICECEDLHIEFPKELMACEKSSADFKNKIQGGLMDRYVCAIDGWLCRIQVARFNEVSFITGFFSGNYQCYGLNVQAACDADCKFIYFSVKIPGGTNDSFEYSHCKLHSLIESLPEGFWVAGDNDVPSVSFTKKPGEKIVELMNDGQLTNRTVNIQELNEVHSALLNNHNVEQTNYWILLKGRVGYEFQLVETSTIIRIFATIPDIFDPQSSHSETIHDTNHQSEGRGLFESSSEATVDDNKPLEFIDLKDEVTNNDKGNDSSGVASSNKSPLPDNFPKVI